MSVPHATPTLTPQKLRFSEVDSLRAVACALVIVMHTIGGGRVHRVLSYITLEAGILGVIMFFAISGFVIPDSLRGERWQGVKHFAIRRFWRLYPPFWIALLLTCWIDPNYRIGRLCWDATMLPSLKIARAFGPFWTLELELIFYLLVAVLYLIFGRLGWRVLLPSFLFLVLFLPIKILTPNAIWDYDSALPNLVVMFWGGLSREILRFDFSRWPQLAPIRGVDWARATALGLVSGITLSVLLMTTSATRGTGRSFELAGVLGILGFLFWVILKPVRIAWLSQIGRWTYSTYLMHGPLLITFIPFIPLLGSLTRLAGLSISFALVLSFTVGALAYRWIEQPSDRIGKRITNRQREAAH